MKNLDFVLFSETIWLTQLLTIIDLFSSIRKKPLGNILGARQNVGYQQSFFLLQLVCFTGNGRILTNIYFMICTCSYMDVLV